MTPQPNPIMSFVPLLFVIAVIYFLIIRPQQKQQKELKKQINGLKTGDKVLTQGGILGIVSSMKGDIVQVKIAENIRVDFTRESIAKVYAETVPMLTVEKP